jgi:hypothetical protein
MGEPKPKKAVHNAGAFLSDGRGMLAVPMHTLSDDYHDEPTEPEDSDRVPQPEPPSRARRLIDRLGGRSARRS